MQSMLISRLNELMDVFARASCVNHCGHVFRWACLEMGVGL